jgi:hypothetical protein
LSFRAQRGIPRCAQDDIASLRMTTKHSSGHALQRSVSLSSPKLEVLRTQNPVRYQIAVLILTQQPGNEALGHDRGGVPLAGLEWRVEVSVFRLQAGFPTSR